MTTPRHPPAVGRAIEIRLGQPRRGESRPAGPRPVAAVPRLARWSRRTHRRGTRRSFQLHDGAQQYLVAIAVKAGLIQQLGGGDTARSTALLAELASDTQSALDDLRNLAHGIYPPLLSSAGLGEALSAACRRASL